MSDKKKSHVWQIVVPIAITALIFLGTPWTTRQGLTLKLLAALFWMAVISSSKRAFKEPKFQKHRQDDDISDRLKWVVGSARWGFIFYLKDALTWIFDRWQITLPGIAVAAAWIYTSNQFFTTSTLRVWFSAAGLGCCISWLIWSFFPELQKKSYSQVKTHKIKSQWDKIKEQSGLSLCPQPKKVDTFFGDDVIARYEFDTPISYDDQKKLAEAIRLNTEAGLRFTISHADTDKDKPIISIHSTDVPETQKIWAQVAAQNPLLQKEKEEPVELKHFEESAPGCVEMILHPHGGKENFANVAAGIAHHWPGASHHEWDYTGHDKSDLYVETSHHIKPQHVYVTSDKKNVKHKRKFESSDFRFSDKKVLLGSTVDGKPLIWDRTCEPHCFVAGPTGHGKGVCLSAIIGSAVYSYQKVWIVNKKGAGEFKAWESNPNVEVHPGGTQDILKFFRAAEVERVRRQKILNDHPLNPDDWASYQKIMGSSEGEFADLFLIIDEMAAIFTTAQIESNTVFKEIGNSLSLLFQQARSSGIHIVAATQQANLDQMGNAKIGKAVRDNCGAAVLVGKPKPGQAKMVLGVPDSHYALAESKKNLKGDAMTVGLNSDQLDVVKGRIVWLTAEDKSFLASV